VEVGPLLPTRCIDIRAGAAERNEAGG